MERLICPIEILDFLFLFCLFGLIPGKHIAAIEKIKYSTELYRISVSHSVISLYVVITLNSCHQEKRNSLTVEDPL